MQSFVQLYNLVYSYTILYTAIQFRTAIRTCIILRTSYIYCSVLIFRRIVSKCALAYLTVLTVCINLLFVISLW